MDERQKFLLDRWSVGELSRGELREAFPAMDFDDSQFVRREIEAALESNCEEEVEYAVQLLLLHDGDLVDLKNHLLVVPGHRHHQEIAKELQRIADPSTVPFVARVLAGGFHELDYTCSESSAIAKWFSWLLI